MDKRFNKLKKLIKDKLVTQNFLRPDDPGLFVLKHFEYSQTAAKLDAFMRWLEETMAEVILDVSPSPTSVITEIPWTNEFIEQGYLKGVDRAGLELAKAGALGPFIEPGLVGSIGGTIHVDRLALLFTRTFEGLKGITPAISSELSRILSQGMIEGKNPNVIAREINKSIDTIKIKRARVLARTEVIRAHHLANVNEFERAGIVEVEVLAEWVTAGDGRVCLICQGLEGTIWKLEDIRGALPAHAQCRCVIVPIVQEPSLRRRL
jgi:SPP1 gp7 family putative phage head morphogenesis protein